MNKNGLKNQDKNEIMPERASNSHRTLISPVNKHQKQKNSPNHQRAEQIDYG